MNSVMSGATDPGAETTVYVELLDEGVFVGGPRRAVRPSLGAPGPVVGALAAAARGFAGAAHARTGYSAAKSAAAEARSTETRRETPRSAMVTP